MPDGILSQLPDLSAIESTRSAIVSGFSAAQVPLSVDASNLTGGLTSVLDSLKNNLPTDPQALAALLKGSLDDIFKLLPEDQLAEIQNFKKGLDQALEIVAPAKDILFSNGNLRDLKDIVMEKAGDPTQFITTILSNLTGVLPTDSIDILKTFVSTIKNFESSIPSDPAAIAEFLAQGIIGAPLDLLSGPLGIVNGFHEQIENLVDGTKLNDFTSKIQSAATQCDAARTLITAFDPTDSASYQEIIAALQTVQTTLSGFGTVANELVTNMQNKLPTLNPGSLTGGLLTSLENVPEISIARVDDFYNLVLDPVRELNQKLDEITPEQLRQSLVGAKSYFDEMIAPHGYDEIRELVLSPFQAIGAEIDKLDITVVKTAIENTLKTVGDGIDQAAGGIQSVKNEIKSALELFVNQAANLNTGFAEVENTIDELTNTVGSTIENIPVTTLKEKSADALNQVLGLLNNFKSNVSDAQDEVKTFIEKVEKIDLRQGAEPFFELVEDIKKVLEKIDLSILPGNVRDLVKKGTAVLDDIDLGPARTDLLAAYDKVDPVKLLDEIINGYKDVIDNIREFDPAKLIAPLTQAFEEMQTKLTAFDLTALLTPVIAEVEKLKEEVAKFSPTALAAALAEPFDEINKALDEVAPAKLLAPVVEIYNDFIALFEKLDIMPFLAELDAQFSQWLEQGLNGMQAMADGFSGTGDMKSYLDNLGTGDGGDEIGFMPGDILRPVEDLFNKIMELLDRVPEAQLLAGFEHTKSRFGGALNAINPSRLLSEVDGKLHGRLAAFDFTAEFELISDLHGCYSQLLLAFDSIDPVLIPTDLETKYREINDLVLAINPERVLEPIRPALRALQQDVLVFLGALDFSNLAGVFGPVQAKISGFLPAFLGGELSVSAIKAELQKVNPGKLADEVNVAFEQTLIKLSGFAGVLKDEIPQILQSVAGGATAFLPELFGEAFRAVYEPLRNKLDALSPESVIAVLESEIYTPIREVLNSLSPAAIVADLELEDSFAQITVLFDTAISSLHVLQTGVSSTWETVLAKVEELNPQFIVALTEDAVDGIEEVLNDIDFANLLTLLKETLGRIREDLERLLQDAEVAIEQMIEAIPE